MKNLKAQNMKQDMFFGLFISPFSCWLSHSLCCSNKVNKGVVTRYIYRVIMEKFPVHIEIFQGELKEEGWGKALSKHHLDLAAAFFGADYDASANNMRSPKEKKNQKTSSIKPWARQTSKRRWCSLKANNPFPINDWELGSKNYKLSLSWELFVSLTFINLGLRFPRHTGPVMSHVVRLFFIFFSAENSTWYQFASIKTKSLSGIASEWRTIQVKRCEHSVWIFRRKKDAIYSNDLRLDWTNVSWKRLLLLFWIMLQVFWQEPLINWFWKKFERSRRSNHKKLASNGLFPSSTPTVFPRQTQTRTTLMCARR